MSKQIAAKPLVGSSYVGRCVRWIHNGDRFGFGFLNVHGVSRDVYVSGRNLVDVRQLKPGDMVRFAVTTDRLGRLEAVNCRFL